MEDKSSAEWDKARGVICAQCGQEVWRIRNGICLPCHYNNDSVMAEKQGVKKEKRMYRRALNSGTISLAQLKKGELPEDSVLRL